MQLIKEMQSAPTEIDLMKDTIAILTNSSAPAEEVLLALEALQSLVEPIDNANGKCQSRVSTARSYLMHVKVSPCGGRMHPWYSRACAARNERTCMSHTPVSQ